jgi:malate dehydrogenase (oxaloacetate-decarboxylating)
MKLAAAYAISECMPMPTRDMIIPPALNEMVAFKVAEAVRKVALEEFK